MWNTSIAWIWQNNIDHLSWRKTVQKCTRSFSSKKRLNSTVSKYLSEELALWPSSWALDYGKWRGDIDVFPVQWDRLVEFSCSKAILRFSHKCPFSVLKRYIMYLFTWNSKSVSFLYIFKPVNNFSLNYEVYTNSVGYSLLNNKHLEHS